MWGLVGWEEVTKPQPLRLASGAWGVVVGGVYHWCGGVWCGGCENTRHARSMMRAACEYLSIFHAGWGILERGNAGPSGATCAPVTTSLEITTTTTTTNNKGTGGRK
jgi:hypothetical protein